MQCRTALPVRLLALGQTASAIISSGTKWWRSVKRNLKSWPGRCPTHSPSSGPCEPVTRSRPSVWTFSRGRASQASAGAEQSGAVAGRTWKGRYRGQRQKWFAVRFTGDDNEINVIAPGGGHKPEFIKWRWEPMKNLPDLIVPFKRPVYERVVKEFSKLSGG